MNPQNPCSHRILALPGSLRRASCNRKLLEASVHHAAGSLRIKLFDGLMDVPMFNEDMESVNPLHAGAVHLREAVAGADGLLIATPEYNQSIPGVLKNAIDWLSRSLPEEVLVGKPVAILGASTGRWGTRLAQAALRQTLTAAEAHVMPAPMLFVRDADHVFDGDGALRDAGTSEALRAFLLAFSDWIELVGTRREAIAA
ncbi:MAG TPA: NADPH-dependent FMN reductase [Rhodanobacteraceae bacterium]|nr:NADPH-dependent FMN reductase [Rhodanobacteraceae bacterium]